jgi:hypothetical protein
VAADVWVSECVPCRWVEHHDSQDAAIRAAEDHVFTTHRDIPGFQRANEFIGHVQLRADNAVATLTPSQASSDSGPLPPAPETGGPNTGSPATPAPDSTAQSDPTAQPNT